MNTIRVDICYRPFRIGWAIRSDDFDAFRQAVRLSYTLCGGRFNPILMVDREEESQRLIDLFRVDLIWPIGASDEVKDFPKKFPHLIKPFFLDTLFEEIRPTRKYAKLLDINNALVNLRDKPEWKVIKEKGVRLYTWRPDDPLSDIFLVQLGAYPSAEEIGIDYRAKLANAFEATEHIIDPSAVIPSDIIEYPSIAYFSRHGLKHHHSVAPGRNSPGFFVGDPSNLDDLVCHWNLRAADIPLWFVDPSSFARYADIVPLWERAMREKVAQRNEWDRHISVWSRCEDINEECKLFGDIKLMRCHVSDAIWNGRNVRASMMFLNTVSVLGVIGEESGKSRVSFALNEKPVSDDIWLRQQHLVASISFTGGYNDEHNTLIPPYIPELNEFYAREMHFQYDKLRIEPGRVGIIIEANEHDSFLYALPVVNLIDRIFGMAGYVSKLSKSGLITRQLIAHLGGVDGARVFKIPGVRRLLKTHGPMAPFTKGSALQLIGQKDPKNPDAKFNDYEDLYIEPRPRGSKLKPDDVFAHLVEKSLFRIGAKLTCPNCNMDSWTALDDLKQHIVCELCGHKHNATRQLMNGELHYRRSGVLGAEKNAQGAVPVVLTLQQLAVNVHGSFFNALYSPSLDLDPKNGNDLPKCEVDFVWLLPRPYPRKTVVILGECKDTMPIDNKDMENLSRVADALPRKRFKTFILLSKMCPFTSEEIKMAKSLNDKYRERAILLTSRELEPYHIYERTNADFDIRRFGGRPEGLAQATSLLYFKE